MSVVSEILEALADPTMRLSHECRPVSEHCNGEGTDRVERTYCQIQESSMGSPVDYAQKKKGDREFHEAYTANHQQSECPEVALHCNHILRWYIISLLS